MLPKMAGFVRLLKNFLLVHEMQALQGDSPQGGLASEG